MTVATPDATLKQSRASDTQRHRLGERFATLRERGEGALIAYFPLGGEHAPNDLAQVYAEAGVDVLEIGFPVARPILDGRVIRESMRIARESGWASERFFEGIHEIRARHPSLILQVFAYREVLESFSPERFARLCEQSGADAVLIVGSDAKELRTLDGLLPENLINLRFAPHFYSEDELAELRSTARGYVFFQATEGKTGARDELAVSLGNGIGKLKQSLPNVPVCAGFGLSTAAQCRQVRGFGADGAIVGSAIVQQLHAGTETALADTGRFIEQLKVALRLAS